MFSLNWVTSEEEMKVWSQNKTSLRSIWKCYNCIIWSRRTLTKVSRCLRDLRDGNSKLKKKILIIDFCNFVKTTAGLIPKTITGTIQNYCFALSKSHFLPWPCQYNSLTLATMSSDSSLFWTSLTDGMYPVMECSGPQVNYQRRKLLHRLFLTQRSEFV